MKPPLTEEIIVAAAKKYHARMGKWPTGAPCDATVDFGYRENWSNISSTLYAGGRGLPTRGTLRQLLIRHGLRKEDGLYQTRYSKFPLTEVMVLAAAKKHFDRTGGWPTQRSDGAEEDFGRTGENWSSVDASLRAGCRGLAGGISLSRLLASGVPMDGATRPSRPEITKELIVAAAQKHHERTGLWPNPRSGDATQDFGFKIRWSSIIPIIRGDMHTTLAQILAEAHLKSGRARSVQHPMTEQDILAAAKKHFDRNGKWPGARSKEAELDFGYPEKWVNLDQALRVGGRGLPKGTNLSAFLRAHGCVDNDSIPQEDILVAARRHSDRTGKWPTQASKGGAEDFAGMGSHSWWDADDSLRAQGTSLMKFLVGEGVREPWAPPLSESDVLSAMDKYKARTGRWPTQKSGNATGDIGFQTTWRNINSRLGRRRTSIPMLLVARGRRAGGTLTEEVVLTAIQKHIARTGLPPSVRRNDATDDFGYPEKWANINVALRDGLRGLPAGSSLSRFLKEHGLPTLNHTGTINYTLTGEAVLCAVLGYKEQTGRWPTSEHGDASEYFERAITWGNVDDALRYGWHGLPKGSSLSKFCKKIG